jgi:superfamily I DNA/RNA helicase
VAAADAFQCLTDGRDTAPVIKWLEGGGQTHRLTQPRRTSQQGLLAAAWAVREASDIKAVLTATTYNKRTTWNGAGFRLLEVPATTKNHALLSWSIANEIAQRQGAFAILTPDSTNVILRDALKTVQTKQWTRKNGAVFGPYPLKWERQDTEEADALLAGVVLPQAAPFDELCAILTPLARHAPIAQTITRMDRLRRVQRRTQFAAADVTEFVREIVRNQSRFGFRQTRGHVAMTIQRAKNREFPNVIVIWPHSATGSPEHLRRLLYNAMTRAVNHCSVIVLGSGRLSDPPFAPAAN